MRLFAIPAGPIETNAWLLVNENTKGAILFDAPPQSYKLVQAELDKNDCQLKALFITHGHWDHMLDAALFEEEGVALYAHKDAKEFLEHPEQMSDYAMPGLEWRPTKISTIVDQGDLLTIDGMDLEVRFTPGHCPGSILIYIKEVNAAVTGDLIFNGSIGRTDLPGGSFDQLRDEILNKVYTLPDSTLLCPGHGGTTTVEKEKKTNPFVRES